MCVCARSRATRVKHLKVRGHTSQALVCVCKVRGHTSQAPAHAGCRVVQQLQGWCAPGKHTERQASTLSRRVDARQASTLSARQAHCSHNGHMTSSRREHSLHLAPLPPLGPSPSSPHLVAPPRCPSREASAPLPLLLAPYPPCWQREAVVGVGAGPGQGGRVPEEGAQAAECPRRHTGSGRGVGPPPAPARQEAYSRAVAGPCDAQLGGGHPPGGC